MNKTSVFTNCHYNTPPVITCVGVLLTPVTADLHLVRHRSPISVQIPKKKNFTMYRKGSKEQGTTMYPTIGRGVYHPFTKNMRIHFTSLVLYSHFTTTDTKSLDPILFGLRLWHCYQFHQYL